MPISVFIFKHLRNKHSLKVTTNHSLMRAGRHNLLQLLHHTSNLLHLDLCQSRILLTQQVRQSANSLVDQFQITVLNSQRSRVVNVEEERKSNLVNVSHTCRRMIIEIGGNLVIIIDHHY